MDDHFTTAEFAERLKFRPQTALKSYSLRGHYLNIIPLKLPNGRLLWPAAEVKRLLNPQHDLQVNCG